MKSLHPLKNPGKDNGIAIIFSLIMLSIFFLIGFGFISMATSYQRAAKARQPRAQARLTNNETILSEAFGAINEKFYTETTAGVRDETEQSHEVKYFKDLVFTNGTDEVTLKAWGTRRSQWWVNPTTNIADAWSLRLGQGLKPDTNIATNPNWDDYGTSALKFGWQGADSSKNDEYYAWLVLESNGLDPNYMGGGTMTPVMVELPSTSATPTLTSRTMSVQAYILANLTSAFLTQATVKTASMTSIPTGPTVRALVSSRGIIKMSSFPLCPLILKPQ